MLLATRIGQKLSKTFGNGFVLEENEGIAVLDNRLMELRVLRCEIAAKEGVLVVCETFTRDEEDQVAFAC